MLSRKEQLFAHVFLVFLDTYGEDWIQYKDEFHQHVTVSCREFNLSEVEFYHWLNQVIGTYIKKYVGVDRK